MLYDRYAPVLFGICRRYIRQNEDAEDVLLETFYKIYSNIGQYGFKGSFEGWMKRIAINESLMFLRKNKNPYLRAELNDIFVEGSPNVEELLFEQDVMKLLEQLPVGYRTVFNLYVIEGYKHREIAEQLGISINTSKSQLIQAKRKLSQLIKKNKVTRAS
ncbi:MAG: sigma-70 family RNA polymerase sigma factor [Saprospiraceae bacterium]|nr:sigma-70 family RNA polymerase sigma factor [Saprospiraceae bacterium]